MAGRDPGPGAWTIRAGVRRCGMEGRPPSASALRHRHRRDRAGRSPTAGRVPAAGSALGAGLAGQLLVHHGGVVHEGGHDRGGLLHVLGLDAVEDVLVGVVGPGVVLDLILDELEAGQADAVERLVVGAAGVGDGQRGGAHLAEGLEPLAEDRADGLVPLEVDAADLAGAVVEVEVGLELVVTRAWAPRRWRWRCRCRPGRAARAAGTAAAEHVGGAAAEVLGDEGARAEEPLLLAAPQRDPDRAAGLEVEGLDDPHDFHGDRDAGRVVGRAGAAVPGIHVAAQHDDLVLHGSVPGISATVL